MTKFYKQRKLMAALPGKAGLRALLFAFMLLFVGIKSYAQTYVSNTSSSAYSSNIFPWETTADNKVENFYATTDWNTTPKSGYIKTVYFRYNSSNSTSYTSLSISLAQMSNSSVSATSTYTTPMSVCFGPASLTVSPSGFTWYAVKLTTPFLYNPKLALAVLVQHNGYSGTGNYINFITGSSLSEYRIYGSYGNSSGAGYDNSKYDFGFDVSPAAPIDAGITALVSPVSFCPSTSAQNIAVTVSNLGQKTWTGVYVGWSFDGVAQTPYYDKDSIQSSQSENVIIGSKTFASGVPHTIKAWTYSPGGVKDTITADDTLLVTNVQPAISGTYTINSSAAASSTNFISFKSAVSALTLNGVCGPVVFNVSAATYTEAVSIGAIQGVSATNTITFNGQGRNKTTLTSSGITLTLTGSSYINFNNMTLNTTSSSNYVVSNGGDNYNSITYCNITAGLYSSYSVYLVYSQSTSHFTMDHDRLVGGYMSWYNYGTSNSTTQGFCTFTNNKVVQYGYYGLYNLYGTANTYNNNTFDSAGYSSPGLEVLSELESGCQYNANYFLGNCYYALEVIEPNYYSIKINNVVLTSSWTNNIISGANEYGLIYEPEDATAPCVFAHNTVYAQSGCYYGMYAYFYYNGTGTQTFSSNIFYSVSPLDYGLLIYMYNGAGQFASYDGNDLYVVGGTYAYLYNGSSASTYGTYAAYQSAMQSISTSFESRGTSVAPNFLSAPRNLLVDTTKTSPSGVYAGVNFDILGHKRCLLFPTAGAEEDNFGKSKPTVKFFLPANVYPNSPTTIYQTGKPGDPKTFKWFLQNSTYSNLTLISTSVNLVTSAFTVGTNCLKLVTYTCGGNDSFQQCFTVTAPTAVPGTDFIANLNTIQQGNSVSFTDLSTNGPTKWLWSIQPDSIYSNGVKVPTTTQYTGSPALNTTQNPTVQFNFGGEYKVCLTAYNSVGKGPTVCKTNYVNVIPATNLGNKPQTLTSPNGYLFDNGGPNANYTYESSSPYIESVTIQPCADSIYLTFSQFDTYCGYDYVRLYNGATKATGTPLWNSACSSTGYGYGPGYTGGATHNCTYICTPNITKPDTFKAGRAMYLEMDCAEGSAPGFSAYYWSKPRSDKAPVVSFKTSNAHDSVCVNQVLNFTNTTKIDPTDVPTFEWDLDGSFTDGFECVGTCATALWPYFLPGTVPVTLIGTNCGGADSSVQNIIVYNPAAPKAAFSADNTTPTTSDLIYFSSNVVQCVDDYKWTIKKSTTGSSSAVGYVNGTSPLAQNPQVVIGDTGYFDVKLYVDNSSGSKKDSLTKLKYIDVRNSYCIPSVATRVAGIGMTQVVLNTINNTMSQATADYISYVSNQSLSTNLAVGATYKLTVARDRNSIFDPINRDVWIDWNQDGSFSGSNETVLHDSNSVSQSYTANVTIPTTAKLGATVMRVATNLNVYSNKPCGQNEFGAYQDYRVYVTPYNILPVITLKGISTLQDTIKVEQGYPYTEPGDSASSFLYGNITKNIVVTSKPAFNAIVPGTYVFAYNVTDAAGNKAITQYRVVKITPDKTAPALVVATPDTTYIEVTKTPQHPLPIPKVISANDLVDGNLIASVFIDSSKVTTNIVGLYKVTYTVTDLSNNTATIYRYVKVIDTLKPILALNGASPLKVEVYTSFKDPGITITDNYFTAAYLKGLVSVVSTVDTSHLGTYTVTYRLTDTLGNKANPVVRTVLVVDTIPPSISLNGPKVDSVAVFTPYNDPGVIYSDNYMKNMAAPVITGSFYTNFPGGKNPNITGTTYTIVYTVVDQSGNKASVTRIVKVQDRIAPVITLKGPTAVSVCRWFPYVDAGYSVSDNYDKVSNLKIDTLGDFYSMGGTTMQNYLYLYYSATDKSGNTGYSGYRYIEVIPSTYYQCQSGIAPNLNLDQYINIFPNPSSGVFTLNANLPGEEKARISVTNMLGQEIAVVYNGLISQNTYRVDLSGQASGVYLLNIVTDTQTLTKRIEITK